MGRTGEGCLAKIAAKVLKVIFYFFCGIGDLHGNDFARDDGLLTATAHESKMVVIIVLAEGFSLLGREKLASQLCFTNVAYKVIWVV